MRKDKPAYWRWSLISGKWIEFSNCDTFSKYFALKVTSTGTFFLYGYPKFIRFHSWACSHALISFNVQQLAKFLFTVNTSFSFFFFLCFKKTLLWANIKTLRRGSGQGQFHTNHCILPTQASSWCLSLQECGKGLYAEIKHIWHRV